MEQWLAIIGKWLAENWIWLAIIIGTELLPLLPTQANGYVHAVLNILAKVQAKNKVLLPFILVPLASLLLSACTTINVSVPPGATGGNYTININANKDVPITGTMSPSGNTVPVSAVP